MTYVEVIIDKHHPEFLAKGYQSEGQCLKEEGVEFSMMSFTGVNSMWQLFDCKVPEGYVWPAFLKLRNRSQGLSVFQKARLDEDLALMAKIEHHLWTVPEAPPTAAEPSESSAD